MTLLLISAILIAPIVFFALHAAPQPPSEQAGLGGEARHPASLPKSGLRHLLAAAFVLASLAVYLIFVARYASLEIALREILFGALAGAVFAYWLNTILRANAAGGDEASRIGVTWAILIGLTLIGAWDEQTIVKFAKLGADVKLPGGAEFAIGRGEQRSRDASLAVIVPPAPGGRTAAAPDASGALEMFSSLPDAIRRDALYYALDKGLLAPAVVDPKSADAINAFKDTLDNADRSFGKLGVCLEKLVEHNQDDFAVGEMVEPLGGALRDLVMAPDKSPAAASHFASAVRQFVDSLQQNVSSFDDSNCAEWEKRAASGDGQRALQNLAADEAPFRRTYVWSAAAAILAYNHRYAPSIALFHRWLDAGRGPDDDIELNEVLTLRVRSQIAAYMEEWINYRPLARTPTVLEYHRANLEAAIGLLESMLKRPAPIAEAKAAGSMSFISDRCDEFNDSRKWSSGVAASILVDPSQKRQGAKEDLSPARIQMALVATLLSLKRTWIDAVLPLDVGNRDGLDETVFSLQRVAEELRDFDTQCLRLVRVHAEGKGRRYAELVEAQNQEAFARAFRAIAQKSRDPERKKALLEEAQRAAARGMKLVVTQEKNDRDARKDARRSSSQFTDAISGTEAIETYEKLRFVGEAIGDELAN